MKNYFKTFVVRLKRWFGCLLGHPKVISFLLKLLGVALSQCLFKTIMLLLVLLGISPS